MNIIKTLFFVLATTFIFTSKATTVPLITPQIQAVKSVAPFTFSTTRAYKIVRAEDLTYHVYLSSNFEGAESYQDLAKGLRELTAFDRVVFHIANYGGDVHGGLLVLNALKATKAVTEAVVESPSYSMAALLACTVDDLTIEPYAYIMFHDYSGGATGKGSEVRQFHTNFSRLTKSVIDRECVTKGILTKEQSAAIVNGTDIYIFEEDLK